MELGAWLESGSVVHVFTFADTTSEVVLHPPPVHHLKKSWVSDTEVDGCCPLLGCPGIQLTYCSVPAPPPMTTPSTCDPTLHHQIPVPTAALHFLSPQVCGFNSKSHNESETTSKAKGTSVPVAMSHPIWESPIQESLRGKPAGKSSRETVRV